jgi:hypothetical protein
MTKRKPKTVTKAVKRKPKTTTKATLSKASASKTSASKRSPAAPTANGAGLIVLGFDEQQKPRGARFEDGKPDLVAKAADLMGFKVYRTAHPDVAAIAKKLPIGRLYANGRGFVPNIRRELYSDVVATLAGKPEQAVASSADDKDSLPVARGLPRTWEEIGPGHLVVAQESLDYGWWEAIVLDRKDKTFTLRYRDYPHLPRFVRHRSAIALMYPADHEQSSDEIASGHLVIAHESANDGWWEAIVIDSKADKFTLRFRDFPDQPKLVRHRSAIALLYPADDDRRPEGQAEQA